MLLIPVLYSHDGDISFFVPPEGMGAGWHERGQGVRELGLTVGRGRRGVMRKWRVGLRCVDASFALRPFFSSSYC